MEVLRTQDGVDQGLGPLGRVAGGVSSGLPWSPGRGQGGASNMGRGFTVQPTVHRGIFGHAMQNPVVNGMSGVQGVGGVADVRGGLAALAVKMGLKR